MTPIFLVESVPLVTWSVWTEVTGDGGVLPAVRLCALLTGGLTGRRCRARSGSSVGHGGGEIRRAETQGAEGDGR